jgi:hypothetical protein
MNAQHTPTPWMVEEDGEGVQTISRGGGRDGDIVTNIRYADSRGKADAAHIVKCVNAHDALLEAVRICLRAEKERRAKLKDGAPASTYTDARIAKIQAVLAAAGETP